MKRKLSLYLALVLLITSVFYQVPVSANPLIDIEIAQFDIVSEVVFTGVEEEPLVTVSFEEETLIENQDYTLAYLDNINVGTGKVLVNGVGDYTGTKELNFTITPMPIDSLLYDSIPDMVYNGGEIEPSISVSHDNKVLVENQDYTLEYQDNINVGTGKVLVNGVGDYTGTKELNFMITSMSIELLLYDSIPDMVYSGGEIKPSISISYDNKALIENQDYTLEYQDNINVGTGKVLVNGVGDYSGTKEINFMITPMSIELLLYDSIPDMVYNGGEIEPSISVSHENKALIENQDYTLEYQDNINVGIGKVLVNGVGNYTGTKELSFSIIPIDIEVLNIGSISDMVFTGKGLKPSVSVSYGGTILVKDADYILEYKNNINVGTATVIVKGIGYFTGTRELNFSIKPKAVSGLTLSKISSKLYTGNPITPKVELKNGDTVLVEATDFDVSYSDNIQMGSSAKIIITGKGNYCGTRTDLFSIVSTAAYSSIFEGEGTQSDPYLISTPEDLKKLADKVNSETSSNYSFQKKYFILTNDIDISCYENWTPIGIQGDFGTYSSFYGTFDGQGYTISGLTITGVGFKYQGLFGYLYGNIKNLKVKGNIDIDIDNTETYIYVGGICGVGSKDFTNCVSDVDIKVTGIVSDGYIYIGGISGNMGASNSRVINCNNYGNICIDGIVGRARTGGIIGYNNGSVLGCQNYGNISAPIKYSYAGGIVADNSGKIIGCYNVGIVTDSNVQNSGNRLFYNEGGYTYGCYTGDEMKSQEVIDSVNEIFLRYKTVFPDEKYIYKYVADEENVNSGYPILNLSIVSTITANLSSGLALDDCSIDNVTLPSGYNSVQELKSDMEDMLLTTDASINNIKYFDFVLRYTDGINIGEPVTEENFPENGIDIRIPYPTGTDSDNYYFTILHVKKDGTSEFLNGRCLTNYILFHTDSLSPFAIGWTESNTTRPISGCNISTIVPQMYNRSEITPAVFIYSNGKLLSEDNYSITYSQNTDVGTATVSIEGVGAYSGTINKTFKILKATIESANVNLDASSYTYNGAAICPVVSVTNGKQVLTQNDYNVTSVNNINAGTATMTITGEGNYSGTVNKTFRILKATIESANVNLDASSYTYNGAAICPVVSVTNGKQVLTQNDYDVTSVNNINAGTATMTIAGKGNYSGNITKTFTINSKSISNATVTLDTKEYVYDGSAKSPKVTVKNDGTDLKEGTDYTVACQNNIKVGTATVTITGKRNYTGVITKNYTIKEKAKDDSIVTKSSQNLTYTKTYNKISGAKPFSLNVKLKTGDGKITYTSADNKVVTVNNSGKVTIKGTGCTTITVKAASTAKYDAKSVNITIKVSPKQPSINSVKTASGKKLNLKWKKDTSATGYEIQYSTSKNFKKDVGTVQVKKSSTTTQTIKSLSAKKTYYVRIHAYKTVKVNGKSTKLYSSWSEVKQSGKIK